MLDQLAATFMSVLESFRGLLVPALLFAAIALVARGIESLNAARAASGEVRTNLGIFLFDVIFVAPALGIALAAMGAFVQANGWTLLTPAAWQTLPPWLVAFLALFLGDFIAYWRHRLEHTRLLWPAHAVHHSDERMTWTTGLRFHPLNRVTTAFIDTGLLALMGFPPWALLINNLVRHYYGLFIHMDLPWTYGALGRVFVSPAMHRWHHIRDAVGAGVNFATVFSVFDQAFRTYHVPGPCDVPLGVRDEIGKGAVAQLLWPFRVMGRWARGLFVQRARLSRV